MYGSSISGRVACPSGQTPSVAADGSSSSALSRTATQQAPARGGFFPGDVTVRFGGDGQDDIPAPVRSARDGLNQAPQLTN